MRGIKFMNNDPAILAESKAKANKTKKMTRNIKTARNKKKQQIQKKTRRFIRLLFVCVCSSFAFNQIEYNAEMKPCMCLTTVHNTLCYFTVAQLSLAYEIREQTATTKTRHGHTAAMKHLYIYNETYSK